MSFERVCALSDIKEPGSLRVELADVDVAIVRFEGEVYDHTVECWLHGSCFDLRTGDPTGPPATKPVPVYPVKVEDGDVYVSLQDGDT